MVQEHQIKTLKLLQPFSLHTTTKRARSLKPYCNRGLVLAWHNTDLKRFLTVGTLPEHLEREEKKNEES